MVTRRIGRHRRRSLGHRGDRKNDLSFSEACSKYLHLHAEVSYGTDHHLRAIHQWDLASDPLRERNHRERFRGDHDPMRHHSSRGRSLRQGAGRIRPVSHEVLRPRDVRERARPGEAECAADALTRNLKRDSFLRSECDRMKTRETLACGEEQLLKLGLLGLSPRVDR